MEKHIALNDACTGLPSTSEMFSLDYDSGLHNSEVEQAMPHTLPLDVGRLL